MCFVNFLSCVSPQQDEAFVSFMGLRDSSEKPTVSEANEDFW